MVGVGAPKDNAELLPCMRLLWVVVTATSSSKTPMPNLERSTLASTMSTDWLLLCTKKILPVTVVDVDNVCRHSLNIVAMTQHPNSCRPK